MKSLRGRLIFLFGIAIVVAAVLQFVTSFQAAMNEVNKLFDYHMQQMALNLRDGDFEQVEWHAKSDTERDNFDFVVQVWGESGVRVYESRAYRFLPKQAMLGYSTVTLDNGDWRIYAEQEKKQFIQISQKMDARRDRAMSFALRTLWPVIPVSFLLFGVAWWVVSSALAPLKRIGQDLASRQANSSALISDQGVPKEVVLLVTELNALLARVSLALQSQQRFVADAAHELRSPITALKLQIQTLIRSKDGLSQTQAVARLMGGIDRASRLVEQLLVMARQDPSSEQMDFIPVNLSSSIEQALSDVGTFAQSKSIQLQVEVPSSFMILGDSDSLRVMVRNILDNAIRYIPDLGTVKVKADHDDQHMTLLIEDSGSGIALPERERIFDRFYRIPGTSPSGSGLGLAIVKTIADRHHAHIELSQSMMGGLAVKIIF